MTPLPLRNITAIFIHFVRKTAICQFTSLSPNVEVVTLNSSLWENFTHGDLQGDVRDYVQGKNIKYVESLGLIHVFTIGISSTLVPSTVFCLFLCERAHLTQGTVESVYSGQI